MRDVGIDSYWGLYVLARKTGDGAVSFNRNELRWAYYLYKQGQTIECIVNILNAENPKVNQKGDYDYHSVADMIETVKNRLKNRPPEEVESWNRVMRPYNAAVGDNPTVAHQPLNKPDPAQAPTLPPAQALMLPPPIPSAPSAGQSSSARGSDRRRR